LIDTATNTVVATHEEALGDGPPLSLAVTPNGTRLWVGISDFGVGGFVVLDTADFTRVGSTAFSELRTNQVAFTLDGSHAYVAELDLNRGSIFDSSEEFMGKLRLG
jgi:DNA-binding beta-propeller fold protein YncE